MIDKSREPLLALEQRIMGMAGVTSRYETLPREFWRIMPTVAEEEIGAALKRGREDRRLVEEARRFPRWRKGEEPRFRAI